MTVKLSYRTHICSFISSGQFTFLPTFYDPMSFVVFSLSTRCLTHSKTKLPTGLKTNPSSCPASINHLWYTVDIFFEHFRVVKSDSIKTVGKYKCLSSVVQNIAETCFLGHPAIDSCFPPSQHCHSTPLGGCVCEIYDISPDQAFPTSKYCKTAVPSDFLSQCNCFSSSIIFITEARVAHTLRCVRPKAVRQTSVLIRS